MKKLFMMIAFFAIPLLTTLTMTQTAMAQSILEKEAVNARSLDPNGIIGLKSSVLMESMPIFNDIGIPKYNNSFQADTIAWHSLPSSTVNAGFIYGLAPMFSNPIAYEPKTKSLFIFSNVRSSYYKDPNANPPVPELDSLELRGFLAFVSNLSSTTKQEDWKNILFYRERVPRVTNLSNGTIIANKGESKEYEYSTVLVNNPGTTFDDILLSVTYNRRTIKELATSWLYDFSVFNAADGKTIKDSAVSSVLSYNLASPQHDPDGMGAGGHIYYGLRGKGFMHNGTSYGILGSLTFIPGNQTRYGYASLLLNLGDFESIKNQNDGWYNDVWSSFLTYDIIGGGILTENIRTNTNRGLISPMIVDVDDKGNAYGGFCTVSNSRFSDPDLASEYQRTLLPWVIKAPNLTINNDFTFSPADSLPYAVIEQFTAEQGGAFDPEFPNSFYHPVDVHYNLPFIVTGEDEYSFVAPFRMFVDDASIRFRYFIVEARKNKAGAWTLKKISNLLPFWWPAVRADNGSGASFDYFSYISLATIDGKREFFVDGFYYNNVQVSKTADGQYLVAKWNDVDTVKDRIPLGGTRTFYWDYIYRQQPSGIIDTMRNCVANIDYFYSTSMYLSYRKIGEDNWSTPVAYRSAYFSMRNSNMPHIVPSIYEIPVITSYPYALEIARQTGDPDTAKMKELPTKVLSMFYGYQYYFLVYADATKSKDETNSIKEGDKSDMFALENAYPNPVDDNTITFRFSLQKPSQTKLTINNIMGQVVATVVNEYCNASEYTFENFDVSNLPIGTYYYTLTSNNGRSITKMFNIIR